MINFLVDYGMDQSECRTTLGGKAEPTDWRSDGPIFHKTHKEKDYDQT